MREAVIHVPDEAFETLGLGEVLSLFREAGLRDCSELACDRTGCLLALTVDTRVREDRLADLAAVEWVERLQDDGNTVVYLCKVAVDAGGSSASPPTVADHDLAVDEHGIQLSLIGGQSELANELRTYDDAGLDVGLRRLADYRGPRDAMDALTGRQREILETAHALGYFDVPKRAATTDVAEALDLDPSTVSEHLRRAERNLLDAILDGRRDESGR